MYHLIGMLGNPAYGATRAAIMTFIKGVAKKVVASGIRVNGIAPIMGDTNFLSTAGCSEDELELALKLVPTGRTTTLEDIGNLSAYLTIFNFGFVQRDFRTTVSYEWGRTLARFPCLMPGGRNL